MSKAALKKTSRPRFINNNCNCLQSHKKRLLSSLGGNQKCEKNKEIKQDLCSCYKDVTKVE